MQNGLKMLRCFHEHLRNRESPRSLLAPLLVLIALNQLSVDVRKQLTVVAERLHDLHFLPVRPERLRQLKLFLAYRFFYYLGSPRKTTLIITTHPCIHRQMVLEVHPRISERKEHVAKCVLSEREQQEQVHDEQNE